LAQNEFRLIPRGNTFSQGGSGEGKRFFEYLEENPFRLGRPASQSLAMYFEWKRRRRKGVGVSQSVARAKAHKSLAQLTVLNLSSRITA
jgi:hypothetical protein